MSLAASADDPQCATPKSSRKNDPSFNQSHLASTTASPGGGHAPPGGHAGEDFEMGSPTWNRTPASPVCIDLSVVN